MILDANVVIAAHRDDHPHFALVRPWFSDLVASDRRFGVPLMVWTTFLRLVTNRRVFKAPTPLDDAVAFVMSVRSQPNYTFVEPDDDFLVGMTEVIAAADATGDLVPDAYLATLAIRFSTELVSLDRDFARFNDLRWRLPG